MMCVVMQYTESEMYFGPGSQAVSYWKHEMALISMAAIGGVL